MSPQESYNMLEITDQQLLTYPPVEEKAAEVSDKSSENSDHQSEELYFKPAFDVGSEFVRCSLDGNIKSKCDYKPVMFHRDDEHRLVGSFWVHSSIPVHSESCLAFIIDTASSPVPFQIAPRCGFIQPG